MLQLMQLKQPKKIHSEQSNGLLRVLRVGPPRESINLVDAYPPVR